MNLNIYSNYSTPNFGMKTINPDTAKTMVTAASLLLAPIAAGVVSNNGMSAEELSGRTQVKGPSQNPDLFNQEVAYDYFANGKLKNIPEYVEKGKKMVEGLSDYERGNKLNTLEYQEKLADKILSEDVLINNKGIREHLWYMINSDYNIFLSEKDEDNLHMMDYYESKTNATIKVLDKYAQDSSLQNNEHISKYIWDLSRFVHDDEQANMLIDLLTENADNKDEAFFSNLDGLVRNSLKPDLIKKVQSDKRLYDKLDSFILYNIDGSKNADKIMQVLDNYLANYSDSALVTEKIGNVVWKSFAYEQKEDPVEFATKMMEEMVGKEKATKSETALELCERLASELSGIGKSEYDDPNKTDIDNANNRIDRIRAIRTEIKDSVKKYSDKGSKEALNWLLGSVISELNLMKQVREHLGWHVIGYADATDNVTNDEIYEMLK